MAVTVEVPTGALADAAVHAALGRLIDALARNTARRAGAAPAAVSSASRPVAVVADPADAADRFTRFEAALPERSRAFMHLVRERGVLGIADAMAELGVERGKAMGGITGSIARWAPEYGVTVPFEAVRGPDGRRAWRWIGQERPPAPPVPVRRRRRRGRGIETSAVPTARPPVTRATTSAVPEPVAPSPPPGNALAEVLEAVPSDSARFLQMLVTRGRLSRLDALRHLGLARAQALGRVLDPLEAALEAHDLSDRLHRTVDEQGRQGWRWGHADSQPPPAMTPEIPERDHGGVRVRKAPGH